MEKMEKTLNGEDLNSFYYKTLQQILHVDKKVVVLRIF